MIASRVGGLAELVVDGETGFLVAPRDAEGLANAIAKLAGDRSLSREMGEKGRARVERALHDGANGNGKMRTITMVSSKTTEPLAFNGGGFDSVMKHLLDILHGFRDAHLLVVGI